MLISLVIPCYNEDAVIELCHGRIAASIAPITGYQFEIIYVNDGSRDNTLARLSAIAMDDARVRVINLSRNFGKESALTAGLDHVRGAAAIILDADLQDPPELIPALLKVWKDEDADIVYGQRTQRQYPTR